MIKVPLPKDINQRAKAIMELATGTYEGQSTDKKQTPAPKLVKKKKAKKS